MRRSPPKACQWDVLLLDNMYAVQSWSSVQWPRCARILEVEDVFVDVDILTKRETDIEGEQKRKKK